MNKAKYNMIVAFSLAGILFALPASAQFFSATSASNAPATPPQEVDNQQLTSGVVETSTSENSIIPAERRTAVSRDAYGREVAEEPQRYYSTIGKITIATEDEDTDDEMIMLYMKNFNVYRSPSGQTRCSVRFAILTTLPVKVSNISYRLKWPQMETTLSFNDVDTSIEYHYDYALLGDGCYNMDKQPNIIVNRCRARGMTQKDCASKIRWITAVNR